MHKKQRRSRSAFATLGATALAGAMVWGGAASASAVEPDSFADTVTVDAIMARLADLQEIADANGGNRAAGSPGYEASGQYVERVLADAGYTTSRQVFDVTT